MNQPSLARVFRHARLISSVFPRSFVLGFLLSTGFACAAFAQTANPSFVSFSPASPANTNSVTVTVQNNDASTATLTLYKDAGCATSLDSQAGVASGATVGLTDVSVAQNTSTTYYAIANNGTDGDSACTLMSTFAEDSTPPTVGTPDMDPGSDSGNNSDNITNDTTPLFTGTCSEDGLTVTLSSSVNGSVGTDTCSGGAYSITASTLSGSTSGTSHTMTASSTDAAGNTGTSGGLSVTIDTGVNAPATPDLAAGSDSGNNSDNITNDQTPQFTGTSCDTDSTITLHSSVNGNLNPIAQSCASGSYNITVTTTLTGSIAGTIHNIRADATDTAGNTASSGTLAVTIDTGVNAPATPNLAASSDSGNNSDNITNDQTPQFTGTSCDTDSTITLNSSVNGNLNPTAQSCASGSYNITVTTTLTGSFAGTAHNIRADATDTAGNTASSGTLAVTIDTGVNAPATPDLAAGSDSGSSPADNITNDQTPQFTGTSCDTDSTITLNSSVNGNLNPTAQSCASGSYNITVTTTLTGSIAGTAHNIRADATDTAGNTASSGTLGVTIDTGVNAPATPNLAAGSDSGSSSTDNITNDQTPQFTGSSCDTDSTITLNSSQDGDLNPTAQTCSGAYDITVTSTLTGGSPTGVVHNINAKATDTAGNTATSGSLAVTIDIGTSTPTIDLTSDTGASTSDDITNDTTPTFTGTAEASATIRIDSSFDGTNRGSGTATGGNYTITTVALTGGALTVHGMTAFATDIAGNTATSLTLNVSIDTVVPNNYSETMGSPNFVDSGITFVKSNTNIEVDGDDSGGSGSGINSCQRRVDSGSFNSYGTVAAGALNGDPFNLPTPDGNHSYDVRCTDVAGNTSGNFSRTRRVDDTGPIVTFPIGGPSSGGTWVTSNTPLSISITDGTGSGIQSGTCVSGVTPTSTVGSTTNPANGVHTGSEDCSGFSTAGDSSDTDTTTFTFGVPRSAPNIISSTYDQDFTVFVTTVQDNLGNTRTNQTRDLTLDNTPPVLDLPVVPATRTEPNGFGWNNEDVVLTWNCNDNADTRNPGVLPSGVGLITATGDATDSSGTSPLVVTVTTEGFHQQVFGQCYDNVQNSDDISDSVKLADQINIDKTAPSILFSNQTLLALTQEGILFIYETPGALDNLSGLASEVVCDPPSNTLFPVGLNLLSCTVSDFADNVQLIPFLIRVIPDLPAGMAEGERGQLAMISDESSPDNGKLLFSFEAFAVNGDPIVFLQAEAFLWRIDANPDGTETATLASPQPVGRYEYNRLTFRYELVFDPSGLEPGTYELRSIFPWDETLWIRFEVPVGGP